MTTTLSPIHFASSSVKFDNVTVVILRKSLMEESNSDVKFLRQRGSAMTEGEWAPELHGTMDPVPTISYYT